VSSLPGYEVGSALSVLPNVTQNRSCHEKGRSARIYVIIRDGTLTRIFCLRVHALSIYLSSIITWQGQSLPFVVEAYSARIKNAY
jgi:hypothetical protein